MAGGRPVVVFWYEWGIHVMVSLSFLVQLTLLLLADIRRRKDWAVVKGIIWLGYTAADTTAIYALGHMSVLGKRPEHHLMALWAPLLLVRLGGQDNITAYAVEDNRLWMRHLQIFVAQVLGAAYVLYASSIFSLPSLLLRATVAMSVVGVLKYGERVWSLWSADKYSSSSLSATSYKDFRGDQKEEGSSAAAPIRVRQADPPDDKICIIAHSLLHVPKQMFKGPRRYVKINRSARTYTAEYMLKVVEAQLSMMYDLLYTKAAVAHTPFGMFIRVISLPLTVLALVMLHAMRLRGEEDALIYREEDVMVTYVLLTGAVVVEVMSILRAVFSMWTVALMSGWKCHKLARMFASAESSITWTVRRLVGSNAYWSGGMRQHGVFDVLYRSRNRTGSKLAMWMGREDWWDSMVYSWSTYVDNATVDKVLDLVSTAKEVDHIFRAQGLLAVDDEYRRPEKLFAFENGTVDFRELRRLSSGFELELADSILVWHIATTLYIHCFEKKKERLFEPHMNGSNEISRYMFFLLAARPYMLPYPVTRDGYVQLCHDASGAGDHETYDIRKLTKAILAKHDEFHISQDIRWWELCSANTIWDKGQMLAEMLFSIARVNGYADRIMAMIFKVWVDMLCYTAHKCDEKSHAQNLTNGGDIMTIVALLMVYKSNGFVENPNEVSSSGGATHDGIP